MDERVWEGRGCRKEIILPLWILPRYFPTLTHVILILGSFSSMMQSKTTVVSILVFISSRGFRIRMV